MIPKKLNNTWRTRIQFISVMYLVLISLWTDGLQKIEEAEEYIAIHTRTEDELKIAIDKANEAQALADSLKLRFEHAKYVYESTSGWKIDWEKAYNIDN